MSLIIKMAPDRSAAQIDPEVLHRDELEYELRIRGLQGCVFDSVGDLIHMLNEHKSTTVLEDKIASIVPAEEYEILKAKVLELECLVVEVKTAGLLVDRPYRVVSLYCVIMLRIRRIMLRATGEVHFDIVKLAKRLDCVQRMLSAECPVISFPPMYVPVSVDELEQDVENLVVGVVQKLKKHEDRKDDRGRNVVRNRRRSDFATSGADSSTDTETGHSSSESRTTRTSRTSGRTTDSSYSSSAPRPRRHSRSRSTARRTDSNPKINIVSKWTLRYEPKDDLAKFLEQVEELADMHRVGDSELIKGFGSLLNGHAYTWFKTVRGRLESWEDLKTELRLAFAPADNDESILDQINALEQKKEETYVVYEARMTELFQRLLKPLSESQKTKKLLKGLHLYYRERIYSHKMKSTRDLRLSCQALEEDKGHILRLQRRERKEEDKTRRRETIERRHAIARLVLMRPL